MNLNSLWKRYREPITYLFFGVLTTLVNYAVYFLTTRAFHMHYLVATGISWVVAVLFAFVTNRRFVFDSKAQGKSEVGGELLRFVGGRVLSLLLEAAIMFIGIEGLKLLCYDWAVKTVAQVGVVVSNYFLSKFFVFR
ncbi:GtrA family protein [Murdochiella sp. Marseille-P8839]|nr:GtrA family protein [Murdochiella sp. Marseille-P8839]